MVDVADYGNSAILLIGNCFTQYFGCSRPINHDPSFKLTVEPWSPVG